MGEADLAESSLAPIDDDYEHDKAEDPFHPGMSLLIPRCTLDRKKVRDATLLHSASDQPLPERLEVMNVARSRRTPPVSHWDRRTAAKPTMLTPIATSNRTRRGYKPGLA